MSENVKYSSTLSQNTLTLVTNPGAYDKNLGLAMSPPDETAALFGDDAGHAEPLVSFTPGLFGADETENTVPFVEINHLTGCCCVGCGGMPPEDIVVSRAMAALDPDSELGDANLSAPSQLSDLADFLTTDFWTAFGTVPRQFNLTDSGLNPKSGVLHYNVTGFQM